MSNEANTTPTLGDMVNEDDYDFTAGCPGYGAKNTRCSRPLGHEGGCHIFACLEVLEGVDEAEAAPASPIPTSVANEGERERIVGWINEAIERGDKSGNTQGIWLFAKQWREVARALSPALDNTAVEGQAHGLIMAFVKHMREDFGFVVHHMPTEDQAKFYALQDRARQWLVDVADAALTVQTEKAR